MPTALYRWLHLGAERCRYFRSVVMRKANKGASEDILTSGSPHCSRSPHSVCPACQTVSGQAAGVAEPVTGVTVLGLVCVGVGNHGVPAQGHT